MVIVNLLVDKKRIFAHSLYIPGFIYFNGGELKCILFFNS